MSLMGRPVIPVEQCLVLQSLPQTCHQIPVLPSRTQFAHESQHIVQAFSIQDERREIQPLDERV